MEAGSTNPLLITGFYFRGGFAMDWLMEDPSIRGGWHWRWMVLDISCAPLQILLEQLWDTFHKLPVMTLRPEPQLPVSGPTRQCKLAVYFLFLCCFPVSITFSFWHCFLNKLYSLKHLSQEVFWGETFTKASTLNNTTKIITAPRETMGTWYGPNKYLCDKCWFLDMPCSFCIFGSVWLFAQQFLFCPTHFHQIYHL